MLHLGLAGNVLKAVGGEPKLYVHEVDGVKVFPTYKMLMPGRQPPLEMHLRAATKASCDTFLEVSRYALVNDTLTGLFIAREASVA